MLQVPLLIADGVNPVQSVLMKTRSQRMETLVCSLYFCMLISFIFTDDSTNTLSLNNNYKPCTSSSLFFTQKAQSFLSIIS